MTPPLSALLPQQRSTSACLQQAQPVLLVDKDPFIRGSLASYLQHYYQGEPALTPVCVASDEEAVAWLNQVGSNLPVLVLADIATLLDSGLAPTLPGWLQRHQALNRLVFQTAFPLEDHIDQLLAYNVARLVTKTVPFSFPDFDQLIQAAITPTKALGLATYLAPHTPLNTLTLTCSDDIMTTFLTLQDFFAHHQLHTVHDLSTALIEAITNAVYHATKGADGQDKYQKGQPIAQLGPTETVTIQYGADSRGVGLSIRDQGGQLDVKQVLYWLQRNLSGDNLMDTHGRGLFLMYTLSTRFVVNIVPGQLTEIVMLEHFGGSGRQSLKPLQLNTIASSLPAMTCQ